MRLEGPLQAWSSQGKLGIRDTEREPTKSGILGMVGSALGMPRDDDETLARLRALSLAVRVDREGTLLRDFHTAGGGRFRGTDYFTFGASDCIPSERYYLQDASFVAALGGPDELVVRIGEALTSPCWPLYLGRRSCVPSVPILVSVVDQDPVSAVRDAPYAERLQSRMLRLIVESADEDGDSEPRYDVPLSFREGDRRYTVRHVRVEWLEVAPDQGEHEEVRA